MNAVNRTYQLNVFFSLIINSNLKLKMSDSKTFLAHGTSSAIELFVHDVMYNLNIW